MRAWDAEQLKLALRLVSGRLDVLDLISIEYDLLGLDFYEFTEHPSRETVLARAEEIVFKAILKGEAVLHE